MADNKNTSDYKKAETDAEKLAKVEEAKRKQAEINRQEAEEMQRMMEQHKKAIDEKEMARQRHHDLLEEEKEEGRIALKRLQEQQEREAKEHYEYAHHSHHKYEDGIFTTSQINKAFKIYNAGFVGLVASTAILLYMHHDLSMLMVVSGLTMALSAVMALNRKLISFFWGVIGLSTHAYLSWEIHDHSFTGDFMLNMFDLIAQPIGFIMWYNAIKKFPEISHYNDSIGGGEFDKIMHTKVPVRRLGTRGIIIAVLGVCALYGIWLFAYLNHLFIDTFVNEKAIDHADTILNSLAVMGQFLMILRYREQWIVWIIVDIVGIYLWSHSMTPVAAMQSLLLLLNSFVALYLWSKESRLAEYLQDHDELELIEIKKHRKH